MGQAKTSTVRTSVGASESFDTVEAAAEAAARARAGTRRPLRPGGCLRLGPAPGTGEVAALRGARPPRAEVADRLRGGRTVAAGRELEDTPSVVVWAASLPGAVLQTMHVIAERDAEGFRLLGLPESLTEAPEDEGVTDESLVALCDPFSFPAEELLAALERSSAARPCAGRSCQRVLRGRRDVDAGRRGSHRRRGRGETAGSPGVALRLPGGGSCRPGDDDHDRRGQRNRPARRQAGDGAARGGDRVPSRRRERSWRRRVC